MKKDTRIIGVRNPPSRVNSPTETPCCERTKKATAQMSFIQERFEETKNEYGKAQAKLAAYLDANKNITSAIAKTEKDQLENEFQFLLKKIEERGVKTIVFKKRDLPKTYVLRTL